MPRPRKDDGLIWRERKGWCTRTMVEIDGETVRKTVALGTRDKVVARRKVARMLAERTVSKSALTVAEAAAATFDRWVRDGVKTAGIRRSSLRLHALGCDGCELGHDHAEPAPHHIGRKPAADVTKGDVEAIFAAMRDAGAARQSVQHIRNFLSAIFDDLWHAEAVAENPVKRARMPRMKRDRRRRAVLTEDELLGYLAWDPTGTNHRRLGVLERQTMAVMSWCFGGLRTGELHAMRWEDFDDGFTRGTVRRGKREDFQTIAVPDALRPYLLRWWLQWERPASGLVFPHLRGKGAGKAAKRGVSHASALRRDLRRAFGAEVLEGGKWAPVARERWPRRWVELFVETDTSKPVDFHSFRRAAAGALARAGVNEQTAMALLQHADSKTHRRYWSQAVTAHAMPLEALPELPDPGVWQASCQTLLPPIGQPQGFQRARCDSNARPLASEANTLSS